MTLQTVADITGNDAKHALGTAGQQARRIFLTSLTAASRFGDANVGAARGVSLPTGVEVTISASDADSTDTIPLDAVYVHVPNGATLTYSWGV